MTTDDGHRAEAEAQLERRAVEIVDRYSSSLKRSKGENDARKNDRDKIEQMGRNPKAFQHAVMIARNMSRRDAEAYLEDVAWFAKILLGRQGDLFADELEKINKREERKAAKTAENAPGGRSQTELDKNTDNNSRSDPGSGGAGTKPVDNEEEQKAGEEALKAMAPKTEAAKATANPKPKSQSAQAAEKRRAAALN